MIFLFLADGFEEVEAIGTLDVLRRCDIKTRTVGIGGTEITGAHGVRVKADLAEEDMVLNEDLDAVVLPGGMPGTTNLAASDTVKDALKFAQKKHILICAICAAPTVLGQEGILAGKRATCFPSCEDGLGGATYTKEPVTEDGRIITANGAGSALIFGEAIAAHFVGKETAHKVVLNMQYQF